MSLADLRPQFFRAARDAAQPSVRARVWGPRASAHLGGAKERWRQL